MLGAGDAVTRFAREARAAAKIASEHVARVLDVGTLDTGAPYMVMEFLEGSDLREFVKQRGPLPLSQATDFLLQACEAIAEAHSLGIVHRDLKPANMFLIRRPDGSECVKVLDFGISKMSGMAGSGSDLSMTKTTATMGTPLYMSPEQMESSRNVDGRTDIWALGVILFELLTGRVPFDGETLPEVCVKIATYMPPSVREFRPELPVVVEGIIYRCLEKDRNRRYLNMAELAAGLLPIAPAHARHSAERIARMAGGAASTRDAGMPSVTATAALSTMGAGTVSPLGNTRPGPTRNTTAIVSIIAAVVAAAALGGGILFFSRDMAPHSTAAAIVTASTPPIVQALPPPVVHEELAPAPTSVPVAALATTADAIEAAPVPADAHSAHPAKAAPAHTAAKPPKVAPVAAGSTGAPAVANTSGTPTQTQPVQDPSTSKRSSAFDDRQ